MKVSFISALLLCSQIGNVYSVKPDIPTTKTAQQNNLSNSLESSTKNAANGKTIIDISIGGKSNFQSTFVDIKDTKNNRSTGNLSQCSFATTYNQQAELRAAREENLKLQKTITDLQAIVNHKGQLCSLDEKSLEKELDILKKANLYIISLFEKSNVSSQVSTLQQVSMDALSELRLSMGRMQGQSDQIFALVQKILARVNENTCSDLQIALEQEVQRILSRLELSFQKHDSLLKTNQDLNSLILNLQQEKEGLKSEVSNLTLRLTQQSNLNVQNQNIETILNALKNGDNNMQSFVAYLEVIQKSNKDLSLQLQALQNSDKNQPDFDNLRQQNAQLQVLISNLGDQLLKQTNQLSTEQDYENKLSAMQAERDLLAQKLADKSKAYDELASQSKSQIESCNSKLESLKIELAVSNSGLNALQAQLQDSKGQFSNLAIVLVENKNLTESLTLCLGEKESLNKNIINLNMQLEGQAQCNSRLLSSQASNQALTKQLQALEGENGNLKVEVALIAGFQSQIEGLTRQTNDLRTQNSLLSGLQDQFLSVQNQLQDRNSLLIQVSSLQSEKQNQKDKFEAQLRSLQAQIELNVSNLNQCNEQRKSQEKQLQVAGSGAQTDLSVLRKENTDLNKRAVQFETLNSECRASLNFFLGVEADLKNLQQQLSKCQLENDKHRSDNQILQNEKSSQALEIATIPQLKNQISQLEAQNKAILVFDNTVNNLQESIRSSKASQEESEMLRAQMQTKIDSCNKNLNESSLEISNLNATVKFLNQNISTLQENLKNLQNGNTQLQSLGSSNQQLLARLLVLETKAQACVETEQNLKTFQMNQKANLNELDASKSQENQCKVNLQQARDRVQKLEVLAERIPILEKSLSNSEQQVSDLRNKNNSFVDIQSQMSGFLSQIREKQALEIENSQLKRDLINAKDDLVVVEKKCADQSASLNKKLDSCNTNTQTLQEQLINMRNNNQNTQKLQADFNENQNKLRDLENQNNSFILEIRNLVSFREVFDKQTRQFGDLQQDLRRCQEENQTLSGDINSLRLQTAQIANYQMQIEKLNQDNEDLEKQNQMFTNLSSQISIISDNNDKVQNLNDQIKALVKDNNNLQEECLRNTSKLELTINTFKQEASTCKAQNALLSEDIKSVNQQSGSSQNQLKQENSVLKQENLKIQGDLKECRTNFELLTKENNRIGGLTQEIQSCNSNKAVLEKRIQELLVKTEIVAELQNNNQGLNAQIETLKKELQNYQNLSDEVQRFQNIFGQNVSLNGEINKLKDLLAEQQNQSQAAIGNLNLQLNKLKGDVDACNQSRGLLEVNINRLEQGTSNFSNVLAENRNLSQRIFDLTAQQQENQKRINALLKIEEQVADLNKLNAENNKKLVDCNTQNVSLLIQTNTIPQLQQRITELQGEVSTLNQSNAQLIAINQQLEGLRGLLAQKNKLQEDLDRLKAQKIESDAQMNAQLADLRLSLQKENQNLANCNQLTVSLRSQITQFTNKEPQIQEIQSRNVALQTSLNELKTSLTNSEGTIQELRNQLKGCQQLQASLNSSNAQLQGLQQNVLQLGEQLQKCNENEQVIVLLNSQLQECGNLRAQLNTLRIDLASSKKNSEDSNSLNISLRNELDSIKAQLGVCNNERQQENISFRNQLSQKDNNIKEINQRIVALTKEGEQLKSDIQVLNVSIQSTSSSSQNLAQQIRDLQNQRSQLEGRNSELAQLQRQLEESLAEKNNDLQLSLASGMEAQQKLNSLQLQLNTLQANYADVQNQLQSCNGTRAQLQEQNQTLSAQLQESKSFGVSLQAQWQKRQGEIDFLNLNLQNAEKNAADLNAQVIDLKNSQSRSSQSQVMQISTLQKDKDQLSSQVNNLSKNNQTLLVQLQELTVQIQDCSKVRQQRDLYARQLISFQNRLQQFRNNVLVSSPQSGTQSADGESTTTTTTTQTISSSLLGDNNQSNSGSRTSTISSSLLGDNNQSNSGSRTSTISSSLLGGNNQSNSGSSTQTISSTLLGGNNQSNSGSSTQTISSTLLGGNNQSNSGSSQQFELIDLSQALGGARLANQNTFVRVENANMK